MTKKPNAFLQKQEELNQKLLAIGMDTGFQKCWDLIQLCLRDPEVVGKDTFGRKRIEKLFHALQKYEHDFGKAWLTEVDSDVQQEKLDSRLREIWGKDLCVFRGRYPYIKQPGYDRGRKGWK